MDNNDCKLFVGGINYNSTEDLIYQAFSAYGKILQLRLIRDRITGMSKGYAFITYDNAESVQNAISEMNGKKLDGRFIGVKQAIDKQVKE